MKRLIHYLLFILLHFVLIQLSVSQPSNDVHTKPIILTQLDNWCSNYGQYTNVDATPDPYSSPPCWSSDPFHDVWFSFTAVASALSINIYGDGSNGGTLMYPRLILCFFNKDSTLSYNFEACNEASSNPGFAGVFTSNLKIGNKYLIRVDAAYDFTGTFKLCINNFTPPIKPGQDCSSNSFLCNKNPVTQDSLKGSGNLSDEGQGTCMDMSAFGFQSENNSAWYSFNIAKSGILTFTISPNNSSDDIDFALFKMINGTCNNKKVVRCSASHCFINPDVVGPTGLNMTSTDTTEGPNCSSGQDNWVKYLNVKAGESYALLINNSTNASVGTSNGFTLSFGGDCEFAGPIADFKDSSITNCSYTFTDNSVGAVTYHWDFGDGAVPDTAIIKGPHNVSYTTPGLKTIVLTVTGNGGCQVISVKQITVSSVAKIPIEDTTICSGITASINEGIAKNFKWSNGSVANPLMVNIDKTTIYYVTVTNNNGCVGYDTLTVNVSPKPTPPLPAFNAPLCEGDTLKLFSSNIDNATYQWNGPDNFKSVLQNPFILNSSDRYSGIYSVRAIIKDCPGDYADIDVTIFKNPVNFLPKDTFVCRPDFRLNIKKTFSEYLWQDNSDKPYFDITDAGIYTLKVTDQNNCSSTESFTVKTACPPVIYVPTAFSPNGDVNNEKFFVYSRDVTKFNIKIFSRWGTLVYESDDINAEWDGKYKGEVVPQGIYAVFIKYQGIYNVDIIGKNHFSTLTILK